MLGSIPASQPVIAPKSIQRGVSQFGAGATLLTVVINAVVMAKSELRCLGMRFPTAPTTDGLEANSMTPLLATPTSITFTKNGINDSPFVSWEVVEWN